MALMPRWCVFPKQAVNGKRDATSIGAVLSSNEWMSLVGMKSTIVKHIMYTMIPTLFLAHTRGKAALPERAITYY